MDREIHHQSQQFARTLHAQEHEARVLGVQRIVLVAAIAVDEILRIPVLVRRPRPLRRLQVGDGGLHGIGDAFGNAIQGFRVKRIQADEGKAVGNRPEARRRMVAVPSGSEDAASQIQAARRQLVGDAVRQVRLRRQQRQLDQDQALRADLQRERLDPQLRVHAARTLEGLAPARVRAGGTTAVAGHGHADGARQRQRGDAGLQRAFRGGAGLRDDRDGLIPRRDGLDGIGGGDIGAHVGRDIDGGDDIRVRCRDLGRRAGEQRKGAQQGRNSEAHRGLQGTAWRARGGGVRASFHFSKSAGKGAKHRAHKCGAGGRGATWSATCRCTAGRTTGRCRSRSCRPWSTCRSTGSCRRCRWLARSRSRWR